MKNRQIVFVPGLLCTRALYAAQIEALAALDASCHVADTLSDASITAMAERLLAEAPAEFVLCGLSMGGYVALEAMRLEPQRVQALALMATSPWPDTPAATERRRRLVEVARERGVAAVAAVIAEKLFGPKARQDPDLRRRSVAMAEAVGAEAFARQQQAIIDRRDKTALLPRIAVPTAILAGTADEVIDPAASRAMAAAMPQAEFQMIEGIGHLVTWEAPEVATGALRRLVSAFE
ncbi:alpha/beta fold hydrolase [Jiella sonneratiae]|uniref:Alpha/beta fold hydrolase n=1 Tax=Jiella sonneratiae TaxID=2816856 RepID=A0ABS3IZC7_9HYPH|nr:alpha/beta fold hydrolase [Jiella sonneratiae]MBO0902757.1 alpha/beta fold hydrolase [Jiella sonneratiae]